jgi:hypothetical protein
VSDEDDFTDAESQTLTTEKGRHALDESRNSLSQSSRDAAPLEGNEKMHLTARNDAPVGIYATI